jgi:hypothetical protein
MLQKMYQNTKLLEEKESLTTIKSFFLFLEPVIHLNQSLTHRTVDPILWRKRAQDRQLERCKNEVKNQHHAASHQVASHHCTMQK